MDGQSKEFDKISLKGPPSQVALIVGVGLNGEEEKTRAMWQHKQRSRGRALLFCGGNCEQTILKETRVLNLKIVKDFKVQDTYSLISIGG